MKNVVTAANSAGQSLIESRDSITAASDSTDFVTNIKEVGGDDILTGVTSIKLDPSTGTVVEADYNDGTYYSHYWIADGKSNYKNTKSSADNTATDVTGAVSMTLS